MPRFCFIIYLLLFFLPIRISAQQQNYVFQHITTKDGLASDVTRFIFQDSKGFYWLGYDNGFQKFDGKSFVTTSFRNEYVKSSILDGLRAAPIEDKKNRVFVWNQGAIYVYQPTGRVDTIQIYDAGANRFNNILAFCKDEWDNIWLVSERGIYKYNTDNHSCILLLSIAPGTMISGETTIIYDSGKKCFWLARDNNIFLIDIQSKKITQPFLSQHAGETDLPQAMSITGFWMDREQNLWIGSWNGSIYKYNTIAYKKERFDVFNEGKTKNQMDRSISLCFLEDKQKHIWIGCYNGGLYEYDKKTNGIHAVSANNNISHFLHYDYFISALFQDREGNIWVGTDKGISIFNPLIQQFNTVDEDNIENPFPKTDINRIFQTSTGDILVATWGKGWFRYNNNFRLEKQFYDSVRSISNNDEYRKNLVWCFAEDNDKNIWIGYQHGLIGIFNPVNQHIRYIDVPQFEKKTIRAMQRDAKGNIWFGLHSGFLGKWDVDKHAFFVYKNTVGFLSNRAAITDILITRQGEIWVATGGNGLYCFDPVKEKRKEWYDNKSDRSIFDDVITTLTKINDSIIGIATEYKGLLLFNERAKTFSPLTMQNGLPVNEVWGSATDKQNYLWIATHNGLLRMNAQHNKMVSFDEEDGLLQKQFTANIATLHDGTMAVPSVKGFVYFSPDKINTLFTPPDVQITGFKVFDSSLAIDSFLSYNSTITLKHSQNFITINYASVSFAGRNTTQYYYQLEGVNKYWVKAGTQRFANYTSLNPGHYTFKIKCESRDGTPSKHTTSLALYISPPWWLTWWAYTLYALTAAGIIYVLYRNRIQQLRREQAAQINVMIATQEEERKRISRDLHDDVGTKLSALKLFLSSLHEKAAKTSNNEIKTLAENSEQFIIETIKDVRQLLMNLSPAVLEEFGYITAVEGLVNKINVTKQLHFNLVVFGMKQRLPKKYELAMYRITQELINNVLKHAEAKSVSLQIGRRDNTIILMIEDDGKGFNVHVHKDGYGLQNLEARTKLMQGTMTIDSMPGKGTSVLIEIPDNYNGI